MENKKLFNYLLKDLSELEEMFADKAKNSFDELEIEFIQNRIFGAKKLVQMYLENKDVVKEVVKPDLFSNQKQELQQTIFSGGKTGVWVEEVAVEKEPVENNTEVFIETKSQEVKVEQIQNELIKTDDTPEPDVLNEPNGKTEEEKNTVSEQEIVINEPEKEPVSAVNVKNVAEVPKQAEKIRSVAVQQELQLEDEEPSENQSKRLGDLFSKEKTVNDIMAEDFTKLEHKLSNRPVTNLQSAIGINDRFQYIRELFEGSVDNFVKTVADLDSMNDIKDAVNYLQSNFKWKKNETSLKFINLIKRRFPNE